MEVVNKKKPYTLTTNLHSQNDNPSIECNFENRKTPLPSTTNKTSLNNYSYHNSNDKKKKNFYSTNFHISQKPSPINETVNIKPSSLNSHYNILVNNENSITDPNLPKISKSYDDSNNQVNFMKKDYNDNKYDVHTDFLTKTNTQDTRSVTDNDTYSNKDFWIKQYPNIANSEYLFRDIANEPYNKFVHKIEGYTKPYNKHINTYNNASKVTTNIEIKTAPSYITNYTNEGTNVIHEGKPKKNKILYSKNNKYDTDLKEGSIGYYKDDVVSKFNDKIGVTRELVSLSNSDGTKYNKFLNKTTKDTKLSKHEQNIMLGRNEKFTASMNNIMRYD